MSAFDERGPFKKRVTTVSLTAEQRDEFDKLKDALHVVADGALIKIALSDLAHKTFPATPVRDKQGDGNE